MKVLSTDPPQVEASAWICCQIGAREHYAVPRALYAHDALFGMATDVWISPRSRLLRFANPNWRGRFHPDLDRAPVWSLTLGAAAFEGRMRMAGVYGWPLMIARNRWFQSAVLKVLSSVAQQRSDRIVLMSYSYAARDLFRYARKRGWATILGQIDPGPAEDRIVRQLHSQAGLDPIDFPPKEYWASWSEEVSLADKIVVNSEWSRTCLEQEGIPSEKLNVVPLAYQPDQQSKSFCRAYPTRFDLTRPMRVLFLGQVILRKGIIPLLQAFDILADKPIELWIVGALHESLPRQLMVSSRIRYFGQVSRDRVHKFYADADVMIVPSFSDGFAITQLEAQAWKLPVISSQCCGDVITHGYNGLRLPEVSAEAIAECITNLIETPDLLRGLSARSAVADSYSLTSIGQQWLNLLG